MWHFFKLTQFYIIKCHTFSHFCGTFVALLWHTVICFTCIFLYTPNTQRYFFAHSTKKIQFIILIFSIYENIRKIKIMYLSLSETIIVLNNLKQGFLYFRNNFTREMYIIELSMDKHSRNIYVEVLIFRFVISISYPCNQLFHLTS